MNTRALACGREVCAVGQEGSLADWKTRVDFCMKCGTVCEHFRQYMSNMLHEQERIDAARGKK